MGQMTVFSGPERRRRWSEEDRLRILSDAFAPGACVAEVCRRHDISSALIYTWRNKLREAHSESTTTGAGEPHYAEVTMVEDTAPGRTDAVAAIVIDLARGKRVSIFPSSSPAQVTAALKALR